MVALLAEGVDRNIGGAIRSQNEHLSPSSRRAWIEIRSGACMASAAQVALLAEGVDRNPNGKCVHAIDNVALLAEGVDRNNSRTIKAQ